MNRPYIGLLNTTCVGAAPVAALIYRTVQTVGQGPPYGIMDKGYKNKCKACLTG